MMSIHNAKERKIIFFFKQPEKGETVCKFGEPRVMVNFYDSEQKAEQMTACLTFERKVIYIVA